MSVKVEEPEVANMLQIVIKEELPDYFEEVCVAESDPIEMAERFLIAKTETKSEKSETVSNNSSDDWNSDEEIDDIMSYQNNHGSFIKYELSDPLVAGNVDDDTPVETLEQNSDVSIYACSICGKPHDRLEALKKHCVTHKSSKYSHCEICKKLFKHIKSHMSTHEDVKKYECDICEKRLTRKSSLIAHIRSHIKITPYECRECKKLFPTLPSLKQHCKIHRDDFYHKCKLCDKKFNRHCYLKYHMEFHNDNDLFKCEQCGKSFVSPYHLKQHKKVHQSLKPYPCHACSKSFVRKTSWKYHVRLHVDYRPFECEGCGNTYADPSNLKRHVSKHCKSNNKREEFSKKRFINFSK